MILFKSFHIGNREFLDEWNQRDKSLYDDKLGMLNESLKIVSPPYPASQQTWAFADCLRAMVFGMKNAVEKKLITWEDVVNNKMFGAGRVQNISRLINW